jgi:hypothetical protein
MWKMMSTYKKPRQEVSENNVLRGIMELQKESNKRMEKYQIMRNFIICILHQILLEQSNYIEQDGHGM